VETVRGWVKKKEKAGSEGNSRLWRQELFMGVALLEFDLD